jgi:hypothetical protein
LRAKVADQPLRRTAVPDRSARCLDTTVDCGIGDDPTTPHSRQEIVLAEHPVPVLQETHEQVEDLRFERDRRTTSFKLAALSIKLMVAEKIPHGGAPP